MAFQTLDALTFNVLAQTKTLSAAACCYLITGKSQSRMQMVALILLCLSALVIEGIVSVDSLLSFSSLLLSPSRWMQSTNPDDNGKLVSWDVHHVTHGVIPILISTFISGLAGALAEKNLQAGARDSYLFTMELCMAQTLILVISLVVSPDGTAIVEHGFWKQWTWMTWIPIVTGSVGGLLVGLVIKYAGAVHKGFALIFGMLLSGLLQSLMQPEVGISSGQVVGGLLAAVSIYLHSTYPPLKKRTKQD